MKTLIISQYKIEARSILRSRFPDTSLLDIRVAVGLYTGLKELHSGTYDSVVTALLPEQADLVEFDINCQDPRPKLIEIDPFDIKIGRKF